MTLVICEDHQQSHWSGERGIGPRVFWQQGRRRRWFPTRKFFKVEPATKKKAVRAEEESILAMLFVLSLNTRHNVLKENLSENFPEGNNLHHEPLLGTQELASSSEDNPSTAAGQLEEAGSVTAREGASGW